LNRQAKEAAKIQEINVTKEFTRRITTSDNFGNFISTTTVGGAAFIPVALADPVPSPIKEKKKMFISATDPHADARNYLLSRARDTHSEHMDTLDTHFHITDTNYSSWSFEDAIQAIKDGKFIPTDDKKFKAKGQFSPWNFAYAIRFRDPNKPADTEGRTAAQHKLNDAYDSLVDSIVIEEPKTARKEFDKFSTQTFH